MAAGFFVDNKFEGFGKYEWQTGHHYEGEWKDGKRSGEGKHTNPDGSTYEGESRLLWC